MGFPRFQVIGDDGLMAYSPLVRKSPFEVAKLDYEIFLWFKERTTILSEKKIMNHAYHKANWFKSAKPCSECDNPAEYLDSKRLYCKDHKHDDCFDLSMYVTLDHPELTEIIQSCMPDDLENADFRDVDAENWFSCDEVKLEDG